MTTRFIRELCAHLQNYSKLWTKKFSKKERAWILTCGDVIICFDSEDDLTDSRRLQLFPKSGEESVALTGQEEEDLTDIVQWFILRKPDEREQVIRGLLKEVKRF